MATGETHLYVLHTKESHEMISSDRCILLGGAEKPVSSFVRMDDITAAIGLMYNIQPPSMHYEELTKSAGTFCSQIRNEFPHNEAVYNGLSKKLLQNGEKLYKSAIFVLSFSREAVTYTCHFDWFSGRTGISMHYFVFAAFQEFKMMFLNDMNSEDWKTMWQKLVPVVYPRTGGQSETIRFLPAKDYLDQNFEQIEVTIPKNGVLFIPACTLYKFDYFVPKEDETISLLTSVLACGEKLDEKLFCDEFCQSIRYVETTTRAATTGVDQLKHCQFKIVHKEDIKYFYFSNLSLEKPTHQLLEI